ncbi:ABC transporter permease [Alicyclobacillus acidiphilus]|uniref:ABC transporter permease n=1 Tax=Alicyclobacillus acidiphilus TaxID=182455 RepID=UPI000834DF74|nr:ABC transporter permease [Alicyclobacillus acidiphilus]
MLGLLLNEHVKVYRRIRTWVFYAVVAAAMIVAGIIVYHTAGHDDHLQENAVHFLTDGDQAVNLVVIFAAVVAGDIVANEFALGTIKFLLIRPVARWKILLSKYLTVLSFSVCMMVFLMVTAYVVGGLFFGFGGADDPYHYVHGTTIVSVPMYVEALRDYGLAAVTLLMTVTVSFMISTLFRSSSMAIALSILLLFLGAVVTHLLARYTWDKFILFTNWDLTQYTEGTPIVKGMTWQFSVVVLAVYFIVFMAISWLSFTKRDVAA